MLARPDFDEFFALLASEKLFHHCSHVVRASGRPDDQSVVGEAVREERVDVRSGSVVGAAVTAEEKSSVEVEDD